LLGGFIAGRPGVPLPRREINGGTRRRGLSRSWEFFDGGVAAGDPDRAAEILVQIAKRRDIPRNLPLGVNATEGSIRLDRERLAEDRKWSAVSRSADFAEPYPGEFPRTTET
jgi:hypothetical protein